ncbi:hypothetical protein [Caulobacter sp. 17J80-11]|uniref:hypothetical protein n=1 Tax=Caulobacter sp. 17J80-11 TaxID=2763502 RepID=UPI0016539529|nr:hypothetical protein [Caulobacter sp. 17J80-11]MBC6981316.1 hypothetical protein [Caulobacter sp. 17J80-11]
MKISRGVTLAFLAGAAGLLAAGVAFAADPSVDRSMVVKAAYGDVVYHYCYVAKEPYGEVVYFSESFGVPADTYAVGIENAFNSFVTGRYDSDVISGAQCMGPYETQGEAAEQLNDHMGERRRAGKNVVMTWWRYRGD